MTSTQQAREIIDGLTGDWTKPLAHAEQLPRDAAALATLLRSPDVLASVADYEAADAAANAAQKQHKAYAKGAAAMSFVAALIAALMLYLGVSWNSDPIGAGLAMVQGAAWALLFWYILCLKRSRPHETWGAARGDAETARIKHFVALLATRSQVPADAKALVPLQLEYVRRYLIEDQAEWFDKRFRQFRVKRRWLLFRRIIAIVLVVAPGLLLISTLFANALPATFAEWSLVPNVGKAMSLASVIGGSWYALEMNLAGIDMVDRNAASYRKMAERMASVTGAELEKARVAAGRGDRGGLAEFSESFSKLLLSEHASWGGALAIGQILALNQIRRGTAGSEHGLPSAD